MTTAGALPEEDSKWEPLRLERGEAWWLAAITVLALALRLYALGRHSLWFDEAATLTCVPALRDPARLFDTTFSFEPPGLTVLAGLWMWVLNRIPYLAVGSVQRDVALRLLPLLFSAVTVPALWAVARRLLADRRAPLIASFLVAISPFDVYYAQELRVYSMYGLVVLGAMYCLYAIVQTNRLRCWVALVALEALAVYFHFFSAWYLAFINAGFALMLPSRWRLLPRWVMSQLAVLLLLVPAMLVMRDVDRITQTATNWYPPLRWRDGVLTFTTFFAGYTPRSWCYLSLTVLGAAATFVGVLRMRRRPRALVLLLVLSAGIVAANLLFWKLRPFTYYQHRLFLPSSFAVAMLAAAGIAGLPWRWARAGALAMLVALTVPALADLYQDRLHPAQSHRLGAREKVANRDAAAYIRAHAQPGDVVAHFAHFTQIPFEFYYLPHAVFGIPQAFVCLTEEDVQGHLAALPAPEALERIHAIPTYLDRFVQGASRVWYVVSWWEPEAVPERTRLYEDWLDYHGVRTAWAAFDGIRAQCNDLRNPMGTRLTWDADWGESGVPRYTPYGAGRDGEAGWREAHDAAWQAQVENGSHRLLVAMDPGGVAPLEPGRAQASIRLRNGSAEERLLDVACYKTADLLEPGRFARSGDPIPDVWRWRAPETWEGGDPEFARCLSVSWQGPEDEGAEALATIDLPPGIYDVWVRHLRESGPRNLHRAAVDVGIRHEGLSSAEVVGTLLSHGPSDAGWAWTRAGTFVSDGEPSSLVLIARNPDGLEAAYADISRIALVAQRDNTVPFAARDKQFVRLQSYGETVLNWTGEMPYVDTLRFDFTVTDPVDGSRRAVSLRLSP